MTNRVEVCYRRYSDHRGRPIWVRATRAPGGPWREEWTAEKLMRADLSRAGDEPDTKGRRPAVFRTASESFDGSQPHLDTPTARRATNNSNREDRRR